MEPAREPRKQIQNGWFWGGLVLAVALLERWILWGLYSVRVYNDTGAYRRLAGQILRGWSHYDGTRVPGYPLLMAWAGPDERVYLAQLALGVGITLLIFWIGWMASGSPVFGALAGLAHTFNLGQLFFEANLMSETLSTFWAVLAVAGAAVWIRFPRRRSVLLALATGLAAAFAGLTRPLFLFLPFWLGLAVAALPALTPAKGLGFWQRLQRLEWRFLLLASLPAVILFGVWINFIHKQYQVWSVTTMTGYHLIQHTGYYFEYVPDQYAKLRDTYIQYRDARIAQYGTQGNAIWGAIPAMSRVSGLSFYALSNTLAKLSVDLIWQHPGLYLRYAAEGWWLFWRAPVYWGADSLRISGMAAWVSGAVLGERAALFGANLFFLVSSLGLALWGKARRVLQPGPIFWVIAATIWITSILETLPDHGDNPRFLIPIQSLVVLWVLWVVVLGYRYFRERNRRKKLEPLRREGREGKNTKILS